MGSAWRAGQLAKTITRKKRPRWFWNVLFSFFTLFMMATIVYFLYPLLCSNITYEKEQIYLECKNEYLYTDLDSFKLPPKEDQEIGINVFIQKVDSGKKINIKVSSVSNELLEIKYLNETVFKKEEVLLIPIIVFLCVLVFPMLVLSIFMLIITNIKNPGKRIYNIQKTYLLIFHK